MPANVYPLQNSHDFQVHRKHCIVYYKKTKNIHD